MSAQTILALAHRGIFSSRPVSETRSWSEPRSLFGDITLVVFLLTQCFDGVFTYVGVNVFGLGVEANLLLAYLMTSIGHGSALLIAKILAASLGIMLHLKGVHSAVALLAGFYLAIAITPWVFILFL